MEWRGRNLKKRRVVYVAVELRRVVPDGIGKPHFVEMREGASEEPQTP
jgi:hypothetical protein